RRAAHEGKRGTWPETVEAAGVSRLRREMHREVSFRSDKERRCRARGLVPARQRAARVAPAPVSVFRS
ncbi:hypothetical protein, partial [Paraburkholderia sp. Ac-20336]|uniref:hypothetical protein n=1 Tax=Paraburkholderia sp. Ac-20336 TaxID=2703886 RepID=UPI001981D242